MSFDLAVWEGETPRSDEAASVVYAELMDRMEGDTSEPPNERIRRYVDALLARWPDITTPAGDDSPWADGPLINNAFGPCLHISMVWSRAEEGAAYAASLATEHGLVCFDPQAETLRSKPLSPLTSKPPRRRRLFGRRTNDAS